MSIENRYDFVLLFDVKDGNPNGDPDAGNLPRVDAETGRGLVTDVCLKRKIRNYVAMTKDQSEITENLEGEKKRFEIYVREKAILNKQQRRAYAAIGASELLESKGKKRKGGERVDDARAWMCRNFYDVRTFGAVMSTEVNCGQVRGPVQLTFSRSVDPIVAQEHTLTVCAARKEEKPIEEQIGIQGRKHTIPYGLYVTHGFVSSHLAAKTGFSDDDLELLWEALANMFEHDRSAARGEMITRGLYVFKHSSALGKAPAHRLFERIETKRKDSVTVARDYKDYTVTVNEDDLPSGVTLLRLVV